MKRNKINAKKLRSGVSPYVKYEKAPYRYSQHYYSWKYEMVARVNKKAANEIREAAHERG